MQSRTVWIDEEHEAVHSQMQALCDMVTTLRYLRSPAILMAFINGYRPDRFAASMGDGISMYVTYLECPSVVASDI